MRKNYNFSREDKEFDILEYARVKWGSKVDYIPEMSGFLTKESISSRYDGILILPKSHTYAERDEIRADEFCSLPTYEEWVSNGKKDLYYNEFKGFGATEMLMFFEGLKKPQAKNRARQLINNNYSDVISDNSESDSDLLPYIYINKWGNQSINTSLLAEHIRTNSNYYIVKKQGSDSHFIYWYDEGYYKEISPNELKSKIKQFIPLDIRKPSHWEDTYKDLITTDNFISYEEMNNDKYHINFKNGVLDTRTWELKEHSHEFKHTFQIKSSYDPNNLPPEPKVWLNFIETLADEDIDIQYTLQEWFGLNLSNYNANICKKSVALYGKLGNTGKTKYLTMMNKAIGLENVCTKPIQDLSSPFGTGSLYGTKCVVIDDQKGTNIQDGSDFKSITGMGPVEIRMKFKEPFAIEYKGGITFSCNNMPYIKDDKGTHMFERMLIIPCDNVIPEEKRDKQLLDKLDKEVDGIVAWALEGLKRLMNNDFRLTEGQASKDANAEYRASNDTLFKFINENCIVTSDKKDRIKKTEFEAKYDKYCTVNELTPLEKKNIKDRAEQNGIMCKKSSGIYCYIGIKFID